MANASRAAMLRNKIADFLEVNGQLELMGTGFTQLNESPSAQTDSTIYINEVTASTDIIGYETSFSFESNLIPSQIAVLALYRVGRDHLTGDDSQFQYVRVDLWNPIGTPSDTAAEYKARKFTVSCEISEVTGDGGQKIGVSGTLHAVGDPIQGKYDAVSKTFTEGEFSGTFDDLLNGVTPAPSPTPTPTPTTYTVTFDTDGGTDIAPVTVNAGERVTRPTDPEKSGYTFAGWYIDAGFSTEWSFTADVVTGDTTIYAKWE